MKFNKISLLAIITCSLQMMLMHAAMEEKSDEHQQDFRILIRNTFNNAIAQGGYLREGYDLIGMNLNQSLDQQIAALPDYDAANDNDSDIFDEMITTVTDNLEQTIITTMTSQLIDGFKKAVKKNTDLNEDSLPLLKYAMNYRNNLGGTILQNICNYKYPSGCNLLLEVINKHAHQNIDLIKRLIFEINIDVNPENNQEGSDLTLLKKAIKYNRDLSLIKILIAAGADVNSLNYDNDLYATPLSMAVASRRPDTLELVKILLAAGAEVNTTVDPSIIAAIRIIFTIKNILVLKELIIAGLNNFIITNNGRLQFVYGDGILIMSLESQELKIIEDAISQRDLGDMYNGKSIYDAPSCTIS